MIDTKFYVKLDKDQKRKLFDDQIARRIKNASVGLRLESNDRLYPMYVERTKGFRSLLSTDGNSDEDVSVDTLVQILWGANIVQNVEHATYLQMVVDDDFLDAPHSWKDVQSSLLGDCIVVEEDGVLEVYEPNGFLNLFRIKKNTRERLWDYEQTVSFCERYGVELNQHQRDKLKVFFGQDSSGKLICFEGY